MRAEIRKSAGPTCEKCGSHELLHTNDGPMVADVSNILEVEALRREVKLAKLFRDHLADLEGTFVETQAALVRSTASAQADAAAKLAAEFRGHLADVERGHAETLAATLAGAKKDALRLKQEKDALQAEAEKLIEGLKVDVSKWRLFKWKREAVFKRRVEEAAAELVHRTRLPFTASL